MPHDRYIAERSGLCPMGLRREKIAVSDAHHANPTQLQTLKPTLYFALFSTLKRRSVWITKDGFRLSFEQAGNRKKGFQMLRRKTTKLNQEMVHQVQG